MGVSSNPAMVFDLQSLVAAVPGLEELALPFQRSEIDEIVKHMPTDKAPGPDGFNGMFVKRCWQTIKYDFYALCKEFYNGTASLECINSSYITLERMQHLASTFGCQVGTLPFTYLGLPMGTTKPKIEEFAPLLDRMEKKLSACSSLLSYSGRVEYINTVLTPTVTYAMCTFKLQKGVIQDIDRIRKQCLWRGNSERKHGGNLVAWPLAQRPKKKGGLGIKNLLLQNDSLLMKQVHKFYSKEDIPWVNLLWYRYYDGRVPHTQRDAGSFWWKDVFRLKELYGF